MYPHHINDLEFANALVDAFLEISENTNKDSTRTRVAIPESIEHFHMDYASNASSLGTIVYVPSEFPDARPGTRLNFHYAFLLHKYLLMKVLDVQKYRLSTGLAWKTMCIFLCQISTNDYHWQ